MNTPPKDKPNFSDKLIMLDLIKYYRLGLEPKELYGTVANERQCSPEYLRRKFTLAEIRASVRKMHHYA